MHQRTSGTTNRKRRARIALLVPLLALSALATTLSAQKTSGGVPGGSKWFDKISLSGLLVGEGRWRRAGEGSAAATTTDLYLRAFELGVETDVVAWLSTTVVLSSEWIGDPLNGGAAGVVVDEAHFDIAVPHTPLYFVLGKRIQPFGLFETYLVTDLLVQDAYETKSVGLTAGIRTARSTDLSVTVYKGRVQSDHQAGSGLFDPDAAASPQVDTNRVDSWILSGVSSPAGEAWIVSAAVASEPGAGRRRTTLNVGSYLDVPGLKNLQLNAEYMRALRREDVPGLGRSFREAALSVTASYQLVAPHVQETAGRNYRARKSRRLAHPSVVALRFEAFDDGSRASVLGSWSVRNRVSLGGRYAFFEQGNVEAALSLEYRRQALRISPAYTGSAAASQEIYVRFGLDF